MRRRSIATCRLSSTVPAMTRAATATAIPTATVTDMATGMGIITAAGRRKNKIKK